MSTPRRMYEDPRNTLLVENNDPNARDQRYAGRPGVHREHRCCDDCEPHWETHVFRDGDEPGDGNPNVLETDSAILVEDASGESDNAPTNKGFAWVQGPKSGYRPEFVSAETWMSWQGVYYIESPNYPAGLPNPRRLVRVAGDRKFRTTDNGDYVYLFCPRCETWLESAWSEVLDAIPIVARGIAMIASYIPVYGTALSVVINATVSLAEGESFSAAVVDSIGQSLPGQPATGVLYAASVGVARGERVDHIGIAAVLGALNLGPEATAVLTTADEVISAVASGQSLSNAAYQAIRDRLPAEAQQGMDIARALASGESAPAIFLDQAEQMALDGVRSDAANLISQAQSQGGDALKQAYAQADALYNQYAAEFGYQMAMDRLPADTQVALRLGIAGGSTLRASEQFIGAFGSLTETDESANDSRFSLGKFMIDYGIKYNGLPVSAILNYHTFSILIEELDGLTGTWFKRVKTYVVTDAWRRGFTIAIAVCAGCSQRGPDQTAVYQTMAEVGGRDGFDAGQAVQFARTYWQAHGFDNIATSVLQDHPLPPSLSHGLPSHPPDLVGITAVKKLGSAQHALGSKKLT
jgi:hypothetical protein